MVPGSLITGQGRKASEPTKTWVLAITTSCGYPPGVLGEVWCLPPAKGEVRQRRHPKTQSKILALRGGIYHANEKEMKAYTYGLGIKVPFDIMQTGKAENIIECDYALMHWLEAEENTHLISLGIRF